MKDGINAVLLETSRLEPHPLNPRGEIREDASLCELAQSIREQGIVQPLVVVPHNGAYRVIAGHRRLAACKLLDGAITRLPCIVRDDLDDDTQFEVMAVENIQRMSLSPIEEGQLYAELRERGRSVEEIAQKVGRTTTHIYDHMSLLELPDTVRHFIDTGQLSAAIGTQLRRRITDPEDQAELARRFVANGTTVKEATQAIRTITEGGGEPRRRYRSQQPRFLQGAQPRRERVMAGAVLGRYEGGVDVHMLAEIASGACADCGVESTTICAACPLSQVVRAIVLCPTVVLKEGADEAETEE